MYLALEILCWTLCIVFFWSTMIVAVGLLLRARRHPRSERKLRFAVLVCARNEERVIELPVKSVLAADYPRDRREVIVLADNCTDATAARARAAGATVWEKTTPGTGKGDVLAWGVQRVLASGAYDACAVFDADNTCHADWFQHVNDALCDGETTVTGRRQASNARHGTIPGWYSVYWCVMNELSNRVRTNLALSGKLTGTGFAFRLDALGAEGWKTRTMVEDVEFSVQRNLLGTRIAYVPQAEYADEQPETVPAMWRQLRRWATGGWQVAFWYFGPWLKTLVRHPSLRLFDSFFAILTGMSVAFVHLANVVTFGVKVAGGQDLAAAGLFFGGILLFVWVSGWIVGFGSVALSNRNLLPKFWSVFTFPVFSLVLSASVLYTLVRPTRRWKPIEHRGGSEAK